MTIKLRATFTIEVDADGFIEAADFQRRFMAEHEALKARYPQVGMDLRECRPRRSFVPAPPHLAPATGRVRNYGGG